MDPHFAIVAILTIGFALASGLAYLMQRLNLPTILGYLLAGFLIGPNSPGFVADPAITDQLAEVGVILMLFGVGLHFKIEDLISVKNIALPGAIIQMSLATVFSVLLVQFVGWPLETGLIIGFAIGVASTVVVVRLLTENHIVDTLQGRISIGWLIVEDILTVIILIILPSFALFVDGNGGSAASMAAPLLLVLGKFALLTFLMFTWGQRAVSYILTSIARLRSHELFTLTVLAVVFVIATTSSFFFGTSMALGSFVAGMVVGKTAVRHQAAANALPLKDIFAIIFFISVGMLFNPSAISSNWTLFIGILAIILLLKPLIAFVIALCLKCSLLVALTVAISLAQIGEFSFILAEEAMSLKMLPDDGFDIIVACALISISLNPLLFLLVGPLEKMINISKFTRKFKFKNGLIEQGKHAYSPKAIVVGFGKIGKSVAVLVKGRGFLPIIIEHNIDVIPEGDTKFSIIFGDAEKGDILKEAAIAEASHLFITVSDCNATIEIIRLARQVNPKIQIAAFVRHLDDRSLIEKLKVHLVCGESEELGAFLSLARYMLQPSVHGKVTKSYEILSG